jgi:hypothetical protein
VFDVFVAGAYALARCANPRNHLPFGAAAAVLNGGFNCALCGLVGRDLVQKPVVHAVSGHSSVRVNEHSASPKPCANLPNKMTEFEAKSVGPTHKTEK